MTAANDRKIKTALLAASNLDLLKAPIDVSLKDKGLIASSWAAGFNQYRQEILNHESDLYATQPDDVILFLDTPDLFPGLFDDPLAATAEIRRNAVEQVLADVKELVDLLAARLPHASVYLNTGVLDGMNQLYGLEYNSGVSLRRALASYNDGLGEIAQGNPAVVVIDVESIANAIGTDRWFDRRMWYLGRIRYSREALSALAKEYANVIAARHGLSRKCIVLDLDNTLWGGVIGEDGMAGIQLGQEGIGLAFAEFQKELLNLNRRGILLAICSKNNPEEAIEVIRQHPAMILKEENFSAVRINWVEKSENIREIAAELNIGLDSLVFLDDNPVERAQVGAALPMVYTPEWPRDPSDYRHALGGVVRGTMLRFDITEEDRTRAEMYRAQAQRRPVSESAADLESFYRSLEMKITIGQADDMSVPRVAQLTQKTNQFNLTTRRYSEPEIAHLSTCSNSRVYWMELTDKFGPNGIVGVIIARQVDTVTWMIDTFLMSCRVIGRTAEETFFRAVAAELFQIGARSLVAEYIPSAKNGIVAGLYPRLGFAPEPSPDEQRTLWRLALDAAGPAIPEWFDLRVVTESAI